MRKYLNNINLLSKTNNKAVQTFLRRLISFGVTNNQSHHSLGTLQDLGSLRDRMHLRVRKLFGFGTGKQHTYSIIVLAEDLVLVDLEDHVSYFDTSLLTGTTHYNSLRGPINRGDG
jgi:hypothetical protein